MRREYENQQERTGSFEADMPLKPANRKTAWYFNQDGQNLC